MPAAFLAEKSHEEREETKEDTKNSGPMNELCRLCAAPTLPLFTQRLLRKYDVNYFQCAHCEMIQSETPYWLDEAYGPGAMSSFDTGAIARNALCAQLTSVLARILQLTPDSRCADFGGGHGVFVRMMRDRGMDFRLCDKFADNIFARGFSADAGQRFDLLTSFEVLEHLASPGEELAKLFSPRHDFVLAGTVLHANRHRPDWWYYAPDNGQHVAIYSRNTMSHIAQSNGYRVISGAAYSLFIRDDFAVGSWRERVIRKLLERTKPNRNAAGITLLDAAFRKYPTRVTSDFTTLAAKAA